MVSMRDEELDRVFFSIDKDGDGKISPRELNDQLGFMRSSAAESLVSSSSSEKAQINAIESLDSNGDGLLEIEDLVGLMEKGDEEDKLRALREAFEMYIDIDNDHHGSSSFITPKSLKRMLDKLGQSKSVDDCSVMINRFDLDGDGVLCFAEFRAMMNV